jgi:septal ring factor EnvC (AmiA/AmiB activator)
VNRPDAGDVLMGIRSRLPQGQDLDRHPDLKQQVAGLQAENASLRAQVAELCAAAADRDRQLSDLAARLDRLETARRDDCAAPDMTGPPP